MGRVVQSRAGNSSDDEGAPLFLTRGLSCFLALAMANPSPGAFRNLALNPMCPWPLLSVFPPAIGCSSLGHLRLMSVAAPLSRPPTPAAEVTVPSVQFCPCAGFYLRCSAMHVGQEQRMLLRGAWPTADPRLLRETNTTINREQDSALNREGFNSCVELERNELPAGTH